MKNLIVFRREITERRQKGFYAKVTEFEYLKNYTPTQLKDFTATINHGKRIKFEVYKCYDFNKKNDKRQYVIDCINETKKSKNDTCAVLADFGNRMIEGL